MENFEKLAGTLITKLSKANIGAYIYHVATTGSVYVRFNDNRIGSVRLGNHDGRNHLKYKFNVRSDSKFTGWAKDGSHWRYWCLPSEIDLLVSVLVKRADSVKDWENKFEYGTPKHLKNKPKEDFSF